MPPKRFSTTTLSPPFFFLDSLDSEMLILTLTLDLWHKTHLQFLGTSYLDLQPSSCFDLLPSQKYFRHRHISPVVLYVLHVALKKLICPSLRILHAEKNLLKFRMKLLTLLSYIHEIYDFTFIRSCFYHVSTGTTGLMKHYIGGIEHVRMIVKLSTALSQISQLRKRYLSAEPSFLIKSRPKSE